MNKRKWGDILLTIGIIILLVGVMAVLGHYEFSVISVNTPIISVTAEGLTPGQVFVLAVGAIFLIIGYLLKSNKI